MVLPPPPSQVSEKASNLCLAEERSRMALCCLALIALSQGVPFFHAADDLLRSKSLDRDSYNSGGGQVKVPGQVQKQLRWGSGQCVCVCVRAGGRNYLPSRQVAGRPAPFVPSAPIRRPGVWMTVVPLSWHVGPAPQSPCR